LDRAWRAEFGELTDTFNGTWQRLDIDPPIVNGRPVHGTYNPATNTITTYRGADDLTDFHELLHWQDVQRAIDTPGSGITREWIGNLQPDAWRRLYQSGENRVWRIMRDFGFERID